MHALNPISDRAAEAIQIAAGRIRPLQAFEILWERVLTLEDRRRFGRRSFESLSVTGAARLWMELRGVSYAQAVVDVAFELDLLSSRDRAWLYRELGVISASIECTITQAIANGDLVIQTRPREAYWETHLIPISWDDHSALWNMFVELVEHAKRGAPIDSMSLKRTGDCNYLTKIKWRLTHQDKFPRSLSARIKWVGRGTYKLDVPVERIRIFDLDCIEVLREQVPGNAELAATLARMAVCS